MRKSTKVKFGIWLILPTVVYLIIMVIFPLIYSLYASTHAWTIGKEFSFIGIQNFKDLIINDARFQSSVLLTTVFVGCAIGIELVLGFLIALGMYKLGRSVEGIFTTLFIIPAVLPPVVIALLWRLLLDTQYGIVNWLLQSMHLIQESVNWLNSAPQSFLSILGVDIWHWTPFMYIISLAGLHSFPLELADAAAVDGAAFHHQLFYIILPLISPIILVGVLLRTIISWILFEEILVLTHGGPGASTEVVSWFVYKEAFRFWKIGYGAAASWVVLMIIVVVATILLKFSVLGTRSK
jgi:multiple sugar transport system permease protein